MSRPIFTEEQKFTQWWLWLIIVGVALAVGRGVYEDYQESVNDEGAIVELLIPTFIVVLIFLLFLTLKLATRIDEQGIEVYFKPFDFLKRKINWKKVKNVKVGKYHPIYDFGGWGYRWAGNSTAFNVKGNQGIRIYLQNGKEVLIGTQHPIQAEQVVNQYFPN
jgi:hypothetical protein